VANGPTLNPPHPTPLPPPAHAGAADILSCDGPSEPPQRAARDRRGCARCADGSHGPARASASAARASRRQRRRRQGGAGGRGRGCWRARRFLLLRRLPPPLRTVMRAPAAQRAVAAMPADRGRSTVLELSGCAGLPPCCSRPGGPERCRPMLCGGPPVSAAVVRAAAPPADGLGASVTMCAGRGG
jgi:hypothetical protein